MQTVGKGHFLPKCPSFQNSPQDYFGNSPLKGLNNASGGRDSVPAPCPLFEKSGAKTLIVLFQTLVLKLFNITIFIVMKNDF